MWEGEACCVHVFTNGDRRTVRVYQTYFALTSDMYLTQLEMNAEHHTTGEHAPDHATEHVPKEIMLKHDEPDKKDQSDHVPDVVVLVSNDGTEVRISQAAAQQSGLVRTMMEFSDPSEQQVVPVGTVSTATLKRVAEFLEHYNRTPSPSISKPLPSLKLADCVPAWDAKFIDLEDEPLKELILAANYLDIIPLMDLALACSTCRKEEITA